jgi:hypothetical protein
VNAVYEKIRRDDRVVSMAAIRKEFLGSSRQHRKVHFMRNVLARVGHRDKEVFAAWLKQIWLQNGKEGARRAARELAHEYAQDQFDKRTQAAQPGDQKEVCRGRCVPKRGVIYPACRDVSHGVRRGLVNGPVPLEPYQFGGLHGIDSAGRVMSRS